jgi:hypothetical protein
VYTEANASCCDIGMIVAAQVKMLAQFAKAFINVEFVEGGG